MEMSASIVLNDPHQKCLIIRTKHSEMIDNTSLITAQTSSRSISFPIFYILGKDTECDELCSAFQNGGPLEGAALRGATKTTLLISGFDVCSHQPRLNSRLAFSTRLAASR